MTLQMFYSGVFLLFPLPTERGVSLSRVPGQPPRSCGTGTSLCGERCLVTLQASGSHALFYGCLLLLFLGVVLILDP